MSEELDRKQYQPFHGLRYMEANFGKGGVPAYEFFANVFNMDKEEVDQLFEDVKDPTKALTKRVEESIIKKMTDELFNDETV